MNLNRPGPSRRHISSGTDNVSSTPIKTSSSSPAVPPSTQWFNNYNQMNSFFNQNDNYGISSPTPPVSCSSSWQQPPSMPPMSGFSSGRIPQQQFHQPMFPNQQFLMAADQQLLSNPMNGAESQTLLNFSLEDAFDYIESYIVDSGIDFNVYQFSQRPVFVTFVQLVTACFVSIGDKSMNFNQRTKMEDVWKKLNSQFESLSLNIRIHLHDLKLMSHNETSTNKVIKAFAYLLKNRLSLILNSLKELKPLRQNDIIDTKTIFRIDPDFTMEFPELELLKLSNRTNIDFKSLTLIDENIIKDLQTIDNELKNIDQSTYKFESDIIKMNDEIKLLEDELKELDERKIIEEKFTELIQKHSKDLKNLKINFHTLPLMKNLEILQKKRNEFSTNNDSNDRFDDLIRFIEQFENDAMANIDENMEPITNIIEQLDKSINEKMNMESAKHQSIEKESQQNNSNKTDEIGEINENQVVDDQRKKTRSKTQETKTKRPRQKDQKKKDENQVVEEPRMTRSRARQIMTEQSPKQPKQMPSKRGKKN
ncbi:hypothetical protein HUG17_4862 [Dermatophagoides farinae]|uniref:Uncharacterized protein n=1 Tax=Dermatophagoides farinae TaxID=6954 RepID=A0A9D4P1C4_DERFA|nr:hypothetical protein HUG17_4862 [Dermatophagoides farinae]